MAAAPSGTAVLATHLTLLSIALLLILARVWLRLRIQKRHRLLVSDILVILAWACATIASALTVVYKNYGVLEPDIDYLLRNWVPPNAAALEYVIKMIWIGVIPWMTAFYLCKASLLMVYLQLTPIHMRTHRISLWVIIGFCALAYVASVATHLFICLPIDRNWAVITKAETKCSDATPVTVFRVAWVLHMISSLLVFIFPFTLIYKLQLERKMKIGVYAVLMLGLVDIMFSLTRYLFVEVGTRADFASMTHVFIWSCLDVNMAVIVSCLPALRPLLRRNMKSSSAGYPYGSGSNRLAQKQPTSTRRPTHSGFEVIDEEETGKRGDLGQDVQARPVDSAGSDKGWNDDDKKSSRSDIELVDVPPRSVV